METKQAGRNFRVSFKVFVDKKWLDDGFDEAAIHAKIEQLEESLNEYAIPGLEVRVTEIKITGARITEALSSAGKGS